MFEAAMQKLLIEQGELMGIPKSIWLPFINFKKRYTWVEVSDEKKQEFTERVAERYADGGIPDRRVFTSVYK